MKKSKKYKRRPKNIPDAAEMATKYGTYEIQPTADTDNEFPKISQGLSKRDINNLNHRQPK